jgi:hypothetical protein
MIVETTITVIVQPYSWISNTLEMPDEAGSVINKKVKTGTSLNSLLVELANSYPEFRKMVFDPETGKMSEQALVILNGKLIQYGEINEIILNDKDNVTLAPVIFGG